MAGTPTLHGPLAAKGIAALIEQMLHLSSRGQANEKRRIKLTDMHVRAISVRPQAAASSSVA
jgi:hypothetical protein